MKITAINTFQNVWDALADTPEEAANLYVRSALMEKIAEIVKKSEWTQDAAASMRSDAASDQ